MKKIAFLTALVLVVSVLFAGGQQDQSGESKEKTEIIFWNLFGGGEGDFANQIVEDFNNSQDSIIVEALRLEWNEYYTKFGVALASGNGPDVAVAHIDRLAPFVKKELLASLDSTAGKIGFDLSKEISAKNLSGVSYDGKAYAVPLDTHFHMLYYNKDILGAAGLLKADGTPDFPATAEGFKEYLEKIKSSNPSVTPFSVNTPYFHEPFYNLYYEAGGEILSSDLKKSAINNDKAKKVLDYYISLYDEGLSDINDKTPWATFHEGGSALWFGGVWEAAWHLGDDGPNAAIMSLPPIFGSDTHWGSSHTLVMPEYVDGSKREAALNFMKYFVTEGGTLWGQAGHVPASTAAVSSSEYKSLPYRDSFIRSQATVKLPPKTDQFNAVDTIVKDWLQQIIFKTVTVEVGLAGMETDINDILAR